MVLSASVFVLGKMVFSGSELKPFWILNQENQNYDFAFLGSSRVFYNTDIKEAEKSWGGKGINLGSGGSSLIDNYLSLYLFLKHGNKIKNLFLQIDDISLNPEERFQRPLNEYIFYENFSDKEVENTYRENCPPWKFFAYKYFPPFIFMEFNNPYRVAAIQNMIGKKNWSESGGSDFKDGTMDDPEKALSEMRATKIVVSKQGEEYLKKIIKLSKDNGINLILYTAPHYATDQKAASWFDPIEKYTTDLAVEENIPYLNFNFSEISPKQELFYKIGHFNRDGVTAFMKIILPSAKPYLK